MCLLFICSASRSYNFLLDEKTFESLSHKNFSDETVKKIRWVHKMYSEWRDTRNFKYGVDEIITCDLEDLSTITVDSLDLALRRFITEVRKMDGEEFPPKTLYQIVLCVQFHCKTKGLTWRLLEDERFTELKFSLDNTMKLRTASGIGISVKKADIISKTDEDILWNTGVLGSESPEQLLYTVLYLVGLHCALRAGKEHHNLRAIPFNSQFTWLHDDTGITYLRYTEDLGLKTNKGGLKHRKIDAKQVDVYPIPNSYRCPLCIIGMYLSLLPQDRSSHAFYLQPLRNYNCNCWFQDKPVGVNKLQKVVKVICEKGGLPGYYTNHSLRATAATRLYHSNFDEQVIQEVTGHRSLAVRDYKRTCSSQRKLASKCLAGENSESCEAIEPPFKRQKVN